MLTLADALRRAGFAFSLCLFASLIIVPMAAAQAEPQDMTFQYRGDRYEGISGHEVTGGSLDLLAVYYVPSAKARDDAENLHLLFWLPEQSDVDIVVNDPGPDNYRMEPTKKKFTSGRQDFTWPTAPIIHQLGLKPSQLLVRAKNTSRDVYFPALLTATGNERPTGRYGFKFFTKATFDFDATISSEIQGQLKPVYQYGHRSEDHGSFTIEWNGIDKGQPAPAGVYVLTLKGTLDADTTESITRTVYFQHFVQAK